MSYDYKWSVQEHAMQEAEDKYGKDFYDLPDNLQAEVYEHALEAERDSLLARADALHDRMKEQG